MLNEIKRFFTRFVDLCLRLILSTGPMLLWHENLKVPCLKSNIQWDLIRRQRSWGQVGWMQGCSTLGLKYVNQDSMKAHLGIDLENTMGVSKNRGTPKSSILIGFSIINHPFWGTPKSIALVPDFLTSFGFWWEWSWLPGIYCLCLTRQMLSIANTKQVGMIPVQLMVQKSPSQPPGMYETL